MKSSRKPRGDSVLMTLPEERQRQIHEHGRGHTLHETRKWLAEDGIEVSVTTISKFLEWYSWRAQFSAWEDDAKNVIDLLRRDHPEINEADLNRFGNFYFQLQAIKTQDPKTYLKFVSARHKADIEERKLQQRQDELDFNKTKFREATKSNIERGLDALFEEIKNRPEAVELFNQIKAIVAKEVDSTQ